MMRLDLQSVLISRFCIVVVFTDSSSAMCVLAGVALGWVSRGWVPDKPAPCHCAVSRASESNLSGIWVTAFIICVIITLLVAAGSVLAVKLTFVQNGDHREVAIQVKGKSKGVYNPRKALQILG